MRVLYLEDSQADVKLIRQYMKSVNHQFTSVDNLDDARKQLEGQTPDVFLVDIVIGNDTSYELISDTVAEGRVKHIIALTAKALPTEREYCMEIGCTDVLSKPFTIDELEDSISNLS